MALQTFEMKISTERETEQLAAKFGKLCVAGDLIRLEGDLGAGKSTFARALIQSLGTQESHIPSPTFTLIQTYDDTRIPVAHVDLYRMESAEEVLDLELDPWLKHGLVLVEWPNKAGDLLSQNRADMLKHWPMETDNGGTITIHFAEKKGEERAVTFTTSPSWAKRLFIGLEGLAGGRAATPENRQRFIEKLGYKGHVLLPVKQDASFRSYFRLKTEEGTRIVMDAPPPIEDVRPFMAVDKYLRHIGVHAPEIFAADEENGYLLLEDFGDTTVRTGVVEKGLPLEPWYERAIDVLVHIANSEPAPVQHYSKEMLWSEVSRFTDWYLPYASGHATHTADRQWFYNLWQPLFDKILAVPQTTVLWDFHGDNMMMLADLPGEGIRNVGIIDFQDARVGPVTYDLSMLLQDARYELSEEFEFKLLKRFMSGLDTPVDEAAFMASYHLINLQRTMKILGGFSRLAFRDGKTGYLQYMPRCWQVADRALKHEACASLRPFMNKLVPTRRELAV